MDNPQVYEGLLVLFGIIIGLAGIAIIRFLEDYSEAALFLNSLDLRLRNFSDKAKITDFFSILLLAVFPFFSSIGGYIHSTDRVLTQVILYLSCVMPLLITSYLLIKNCKSRLELWHMMRVHNRFCAEKEKAIHPKPNMASEPNIDSEPYNQYNDPVSPAPLIRFYVSVAFILIAMVIMAISILTRIMGLPWFDYNHIVCVTMNYLLLLASLFALIYDLTTAGPQKWLFIADNRTRDEVENWLRDCIIRYKGFLAALNNRYGIKRVSEVKPCAHYFHTQLVELRRRLTYFSRIAVEAKTRSQEQTSATADTRYLKPREPTDFLPYDSRSYKDGTLFGTFLRVKPKRPDQATISNWARFYFDLDSRIAYWYGNWPSSQKQCKTEANPPDQHKEPPAPDEAPAISKPGQAPAEKENLPNILVDYLSLKKTIDDMNDINNKLYQLSGRIYGPPANCHLEMWAI